MSLEGLEEHKPKGELTIVGHPLESGECSAFHVKGSDCESLLFWSCMALKELINFEYPPKRVSDIEAWYV